MTILEVDPNIVKPGWTALLITLLLAGAITLLMISMRRQIRKIEVPYRDEVDVTAGEDPASSGDDDHRDSDDPDDRPSRHHGGRQHPIGHSG